MMYGLIVSSNKWMWLLMATVILNTWLGLVYYCYNVDHSGVAVRSSGEEVYKRHRVTNNPLSHGRLAFRNHNSPKDALTLNNRSYASLQRRHSIRKSLRKKRSTFATTVLTSKPVIPDYDYNPSNEKDDLLSAIFPTSSQFRDYRAKPSNSYIVSLSYMDQLTWASRRVRSLQCWARKGFYPHLQQQMRVVEPLVRNGSFLGVPPDPLSGKYPKFSDLMDFDWWNRYGKLKLGYHYLAKWDDFVADLPNSTVLVQIVYEENQRCSGELLNEHIGCNLERMRQNWLQAMAPHNITVVKELCVRFQTPEDFMSLESFNKLLFAGLPSNLPFTLVFNEYRGTLMSEQLKGESTMDASLP